MAELKLTKNALRGEQERLSQLKKYLPTLQLKKAMLQTQVNEVRVEIAELLAAAEKKKDAAEHTASLLGKFEILDYKELAQIENIDRRYDNIAGVEIPVLLSVEFKKPNYNLFTTPLYLESLMEVLQDLKIAAIKVQIAEEKKKALERELREVSIRVNLFEKILIPRANNNIKKIKVFLGDQQLAAVCQAKVAKAKIEERQE